MIIPDLSIVTYCNQTDNVPKPQSLTWGALIAKLTRHTRRMQKDGKAWSPASYPEGKTRSKDNVLAVCCFVADVDDGTPVADLRGRWVTPGGQALAWSLHSSYNSTVYVPKWRAIFPLAAPVPAAAWPAVHRKLTMALFGDHADPSCKDSSRLYYLPACPPSAIAEAFADVCEGIPLDPADFPDPAPEEAADAQMAYAFRSGPPKAKGEGTAKGDRPGDDFNARGDVLALLQRHGAQVVSDRGEKVLLRRPGKTSDYSATFGYGGTRLFYCFSSNWSPFEANTGYSPFGVFAELEHQGDYAAASQGLRALGYGDDPKEGTPKKGDPTKAPRETTTPPRPHKAAVADGLPMVETNGKHLREETAAALRALTLRNDPPFVFVRGGRLVRVQVNEKNRATITELTVPMLRGILARCANFVCTTEKRGVVPVSPPRDIVEDLLDLPEFTLPPLAGVVTAPVFAANGNLETAPGYHPAARLFFHNSSRSTIPDTTPTPANVVRAKSLILDDLLVDFPFAEQASRAHAVALLLLPFVRPMIDSATPLHLIDAPAGGTGKGLLAEVCTAVFVPQGATVKAPPTEEPEWTKMLTSVFSDGDSHLLLDNATHLKSPSFFGALTAPVWKDRLLGTNRTGEFENRLVWLATCNNIAGNKELNRRSIWIRMDAGVEQPEDRDGFKHPELSEWVKANRGALIGAALTLVRAWVEAGCPAYDGPPLGRFEAWTRVMGGILTNAGIEGFLDNREEQRNRVDTEASPWQGFVAGWLTAFGDKPVTSADLFPLAIEWMPERLGEGERSQKTKLGRLLGVHTDQVFGGQKIVRAGKVTTGPQKNSPQYRLEAIQKNRGDVGDVGGRVTLPREEVSKSDVHIHPIGDYIHPIGEGLHVPPRPPRPPAQGAPELLAWLSACEEPQWPNAAVKKLLEWGHEERDAQRLISDLQATGRIENRAGCLVLAAGGSAP